MHTCGCFSLVSFHREGKRLGFGYIRHARRPRCRSAREGSGAFVEFPPYQGSGMRTRRAKGPLPQRARVALGRAASCSGGGYGDGLAPPKRLGLICLCHMHIYAHTHHPWHVALRSRNAAPCAILIANKHAHTRTHVPLPVPIGHVPFAVCHAGPPRPGVWRWSIRIWGLLAMAQKAARIRMAGRMPMRAHAWPWPGTGRQHA